MKPHEANTDLTLSLRLTQSWDILLPVSTHQCSMQPHAALHPGTTPRQHMHHTTHIISWCVCRGRMESKSLFSQSVHPSASNTSAPMHPGTNTPRTSPHQSMHRIRLSSQCLEKHENTKNLHHFWKLSSERPTSS